MSSTAEKCTKRPGVGESNPTKLVETLMDLLLTRPNQLSELMRDVIQKGPERADARPGAPRQHRRAG